MKKVFAKHITGFVFAVMLVLAMTMTALAEGQVVIMPSSNFLTVGGTVDVTVSSSSSENITVKYPSTLLEVVSCSADGYTTTGNSVSFNGKSATITFKGLGDGTAPIIANKQTTVLTIGGGDSGAGHTADLDPDTSAQSSEIPAPVTELPLDGSMPTDGSFAMPTGPSYDGTIQPDGTFDLSGVQYVASERFTPEEIPAGFDKVQVPIGTKKYNEVGNGTITLVYLKPASNTKGSGEWYVFDIEAGTVTKLKMLGSGSNFLLVKTPASSVPSEDLVPTTLTVGSDSYEAYTFGNSFYYIYGDNKGAEGWYCYDSNSGNFMPVDPMAMELIGQEIIVEQAPIPETSESTSVSPDVEKRLKLYFIIIIVLVVLCVILIIALVVSAVKGKDDDVMFEKGKEPKSFFDESDPIKPSTKRRKKDDVWAEPKETPAATPTRKPAVKQVATPAPKPDPTATPATKPTRPVKPAVAPKMQEEDDDDLDLMKIDISGFANERAARIGGSFSQQYAQQVAQDNEQLVEQQYAQTQYNQQYTQQPTGRSMRQPVKYPNMTRGAQDDTQGYIAQQVQQLTQNVAPQQGQQQSQQDLNIINFDED